jgi:hypothetical protein
MKKQGKGHRDEQQGKSGRVKSQARRLEKKARRAARAAELDRSVVGRYREPHPMSAGAQ